MVKHTYAYIDGLFREAGCQFLETEEDYAKFNVRNKVSFISKCGHNNTVFLSNFLQKRSGVICKNCIKTTVREKIDRYCAKEKDDFSSTGQYQEYHGFLRLKERLEGKFNIVKTNEGCLADFLVRPKGTTSDEWLMVQLKTTQGICHNLYSFGFRHKNYHNCCIILFCINDDKTWLLRNEDIKVKRKINIGLTEKSEYFKHQVTPKKLIKRLLKGYTELQLITEKEGLTPQQKYQRREQEYFKYREECFPYLKIQYPDGDGLVYDLCINGLRVQDKVCTNLIHKNSYKMQLHRNNGSINGIKQYQNYQKGDNNFYWGWVNKQIFYLFPEDVLIKQGYVTLKKDKKCFILLYPHYTDEKLDKKKTGWANQYMYRVNEVTKKTFQDLGLLS
jgi:hypothetical protein